MPMATNKKIKTRMNTRMVEPILKKSPAVYDLGLHMHFLVSEAPSRKKSLAYILGLNKDPRDIYKLSAREAARVKLIQSRRKWN